MRVAVEKGRAGRRELVRGRFGRRLGGFLENFISQISSYGAQAWVSKNFISLRSNGDDAFFFTLRAKSRYSSLPF
jgi:hypothetical protein